MKAKRRIERFVARNLVDGPVAGDPLEEGLLDSLAIEQLIGFIEDEYGIVFDDDELTRETFATLTVLSAVVDEKRRVGGRR